MHDDANQYPTDAFPPEITDIITTLTAAAEVPVSTPGSYLLAAAAAAVGTGVEGEWHRDGKRHRANIYMLGRGATCTGKTVVYDAIVKPLVAIEREALATFDSQSAPFLRRIIRQCEEDMDTALDGYGSDMLNDQVQDMRQTAATLHRRRADAMAKLKARPRVFVGDCTSVAMAMQLAAASGGLAMMDAEARGIINAILGANAKVMDDTLYLKSWDGSYYQDNRAGREGIELPDPCLTMLLVAQPDKVAELTGKPELLSSGFLGRALMFDAGTKIIVPDGRNFSFTSLWQSVLDVLWKHRTNQFLPIFRGDGTESVAGPALVPIKEEASRDFRDAAYASATDCPTPSLNGFYGRKVEQARRIAVILSLLDDAVARAGGRTPSPLVVTAEHARQALRLAEFHFRTQLAVMSPSQVAAMDRRLDEAVRILRKYNGRVGMAEFTRRSFTEAEMVALARESRGLFTIQSAPSRRNGNVVVLAERSEGEAA